MVDAREQFKGILESVKLSKPFTVKMQFPKTVSDGEMFTFFELLNTQLSDVVDEIAFQVDCWAYDMETLTEMSQKVSDKLTAVGFRRQFSSPDIFPLDSGEYFRKTFRFGRKVDTRTNRLID